LRTPDDLSPRYCICLNGAFAVGRWALVSANVVTCPLPSVAG
jgi:hypothetical protein